MWKPASRHLSASDSMRGAATLATTLFVIAIAGIGDATPIEPYQGRVPDRHARWPRIVEMGERCTGVLVHPFVVASAAHCGEQFPSVTFHTGWQQQVDWPVHHCEVHPDGGAGSGVDYGFCVLEYPADFANEDGAAIESTPDDGEPESIVVSFPHQSDLIGGRDRMVFVSAVAGAGLDWRLLADDGAALCPGDSGGAWLTRDQSFGGAQDWRLAGLVSYSLEQGCAAGPFWATDAPGQLDWIETRIGLRLNAIPSVNNEASASEERADVSAPQCSGHDIDRASVAAVQVDCRDGSEQIATRQGLMGDRESQSKWVEVLIGSELPASQVREVAVRGAASLVFSSTVPHRFELPIGQYSVEVRTIGGACLATTIDVQAASGPVVGAANGYRNWYLVALTVFIGALLTRAFGRAG